MKLGMVQNWVSNGPANAWTAFVFDHPQMGSAGPAEIQTQVHHSEGFVDF